MINMSMSAANLAPITATDSLSQALKANIIPNQEYLLQGSVLDSAVEVLLHRLRGLCDNVDAGTETFDDQEVCFSLRDPNQQAAPLMLRVRKALDARDMPYQLRYIGQPDLGDKSRPTVVRSSLDIACSGMLIEFLNELGCRIEFEYNVKARRLREKQEKERKRRERMGWDTEYQCYTNQDNPFGDSALTHTFVWTKKLAKEGVKTVSRDELEALNRQKQLENKIELEKVKQRRLEREAERAARESEAAAAARAREAAQFSSWARHEDAFHLQQARLRSQIRIRDGRAKPIDLLAWYVSSEECVDALEMHEPYTYLNGLQMQDLEDLLEDIKVYEELESSGSQAYWQDVQTIVEDELGKLRRLAAPDARRDGVHRAVADDVTQIFKGKTGAQLEALQTQIERKISGRHDGVDVGYWESLLSQLKAHMARARLRDRHQHNLRRKLQLLKREQGVEPAHDAHATHADPAPTTSTSPEPVTAKEEPAQREAEADLEVEGSEWEAEAEVEVEGSQWEAEETRAACVALYAAGGYSPAPLSPRALEPATLLTAPDHDRQRLAYLRARLLHANKPVDADIGGGSGATHEALERVAARAMGPAGDAAPFAGEHALPELPCLWADKYRPRKPRYFNRVHTGFEWNKYNQTHYDMDNPPPKIVQGYKFNIFYPDLIDKSATPEFSLKPCAENPEFAVLRFHAGPPYEDIAFKIVSREWEYSYKRGFRCHFHNNIFQLWFHFKRYRYRR